MVSLSVEAEHFFGRTFCKRWPHGPMLYFVKKRRKTLVLGWVHVREAYMLTVYALCRSVFSNRCVATH